VVKENADGGEPPEQLAGPGTPSGPRSTSGYVERKLPAGVQSIDRSAVFE
jgi:hypothetical protein